VKEGATMFQPACKLPSKGFYFRPTIFSGVTMSHRIAREEIFGPVLSVLTFRTVEEAVEKANNTAYGLSAGVWTDKGSRILKMSTELKAGVVWANTYNKFDPASPVRRLQGERLRPRGRPPGAARLLQTRLILDRMNRISRIPLNRIWISFRSFC
jgi:acyl-CoA reductase-like NAD-dependent aldehyde dehydrogenase